MAEWISVNDRLPDREGAYLVYHTRRVCANEMAVSYFDPDEYECDVNAGGYEHPGWTRETVGDMGAVLYWMELPDEPAEWIGRNKPHGIKDL